MCHYTCNKYTTTVRYRIAHAVLEERLAKNVIGGLCEELLLEITSAKRFLHFVAALVGRFDHEAFVGQELGGAFDATNSLTRCSTISDTMVWNIRRVS